MIGIVIGYQLLLFQSWGTCTVIWLSQSKSKCLHDLDCCFTHSSLVILQGRVWALHNCSRRVLVCLLILFVSEITAMSAILGVSIPQIQCLEHSSGSQLTVLMTSLFIDTDEPLPGFKVCTATSTPKAFFTFWIPSLAFETSLLFFAIWGGLTSYLNGQRKFDSEKLGHVIVRDNILYFFA